MTPQPSPNTAVIQILVGVTGSIAAHKAVDIVSQLVKRGAEVRVVMTPDSQHFIKPLPFKTLSRNPVITELFDKDDGWVPAHIEVADQTTLMVIAPATAHTIAKLAHGLAGDALSCIALALNPSAKILIAPAMNGKMWMHPATQHNVSILKSRGVEFIGPDAGMLACGYEGAGRMVSVESIVEKVIAMSESKN